MTEQDGTPWGDDTYRKGLREQMRRMGAVERLAFFSEVREAAADHVGETIHAALVAGHTAREVRLAIQWTHDDVRRAWIMWVADLADSGGLPPFQDLFQASLRLLCERELYRVLVDARRELPAGMAEEAQARLELIAALDATAPERLTAFLHDLQDQDLAQS